MDDQTDIPALKGWFLKEKSDKLKRQGSLLGSSNRRWFTIEHISNKSVVMAKSSQGERNTELALCYYKRSTSNEERSGWIFLNDVLSLSQDIPNRWITIEHPSRILRIQSPTPAQHRVWYSTLSKRCRNIPRDVSSPSSPSVQERRPSSALFANGGSRRNSEKSVVSTLKDELEFLREITGQIVSQPRDDPNDDDKNNHDSDVSTPRSIADLDITSDDEDRSNSIITLQPDCSEVLDMKQTTSRIHHYIKSSKQNSPNESEEKSEYEVIEYGGEGVEIEGKVPSLREESLGDNDGKLDQVGDKGRPMAGFQVPARFLARSGDSGKDLSKSQSRSSAFTTFSRSSSYQRHFGNDGDDIRPDDDFLTEDWDEK